MVRSMTGFGRAESLDGHRRVTVEIRSVNHRFLDMSARLPGRLMALENRIRDRVQSRISRGKVHIGVTLDGLSEPTSVLRIDDEVADRYLQILQEMKARFGLRGDLDLGTFINLPDVLCREEEALPDEAAWSLVDPPLTAALTDFDAMRTREGETLARDLLQRVVAIREATGRIETRGPEMVARVRERLRERLSQLTPEVEYNRYRLEAEMTLYADRTDVTEECVRLRSHLEQFAEACRAPDPAGRRMNFLLQEMNREANTIGSKCQDLDIAREGLFIKEEIEKIREQVQNIE